MVPVANVSAGGGGGGGGGRGAEVEAKFYDIYISHTHTNGLLTHIHSQMDFLDLLLGTSVKTDVIPEIFILRSAKSCSVLLKRINSRFDLLFKK